MLFAQYNYVVGQQGTQIITIAKDFNFLFLSSPSQSPFNMIDLILAFFQNLIRRAIENFFLLFKFKDDPVEDGKGEKGRIRYGIRKPVNPIRLLSRLESHHWLALFIGFLCVYVDLLDFYVLAAAIKKVSTYYHTTKTHVSDSLTYSMSLRIAGAGIFGLLGDYFGRKWPLVFNLFFLGGLQIASIYVNDIENFLRLRAVFGIAMGGIYGNAASNLMETAPSESRGLLGGIFQAGAAASGLTSAAINLGVGPTPISWHKMFWISAGLSFGVGIIRILIPESKQFIEAAKRKKESLHGQTYKERFIKFCKEFRKMLLLHWQTFVYCCLFVTLFQWAVHTFADNYVTFLIVSKGMSNSRASKITMITKAGCILGVMTMGWLGEYIGRRRMAAISALLAALTLPASIMPTSFSGLAAGGFFYQFFFETYGAILAAHLNELSPIAFRAVMPGIAYQFGASVSAPSAMIVNDIAEGKFVMENGKRVEAYEPVIGAIMGIVYFFQIIFSLFGPEKRGADLAHFKPAGFEDDEELPIAHHLPERGKAESDDKDEK